MEWYDVQDFGTELRVLRGFFFELAANQEELSVLGLKAVTRIDGYEKATNILSTLETKMLSCERLAKFVDSEVAERLSRLNQPAFPK